jgi:molybdenum cofactor biosynthesis enzyme MoaA
MLNGFIEHIDEFAVEGWTLDTDVPNKRLTVHIYLDNEKIGETCANVYRSDIESAGLSDGRSGYLFKFSGQQNNISREAVRVFATDAVGALAPLSRLEPVPPGSSAMDHPTRDAQLNTYNFLTLRAEQPARYDYLRFDSNNTCNVHCVYCHNHRSDAVISTEELQTFMDHNVLSVENFQIGCIMEPTLDQQLCEHLLLVAKSRARPRQHFILQTNGILLHRHDPGKIRDAGLTQLSISIDSADPKIHSALRGGTSIAKLDRNIVNFSKNCPDAEVVFITTVTQLNIANMDSLVRFGIELGVGHFTFREVLYDPSSDVVDHSRMPELMLRLGDFARMAQSLRAEFGDRVNFLFADEELLKVSAEKIMADSRREQLR